MNADWMNWPIWLPAFTPIWVVLGFVNGWFLRAQLAKYDKLIEQRRMDRHIESVIALRDKEKRP